MCHRRCHGSTREPLLMLMLPQLTLPPLLRQPLLMLMLRQLTPPLLLPPPPPLLLLLPLHTLW